jgi:ABC-type transport system substrate-binding protein
MNRRKVLPLAIVVAMTCSMLFFAVQPVFAQDATPVFTTTLIAPTNNAVRVQHAQIITNELPKIGIAGNLLLVGWDVLLPRMMGSATGADYAGGGFDIGFVGWGGGSITSPYAVFQFFHSSQYDPVSWGSNYAPLINDTIDGILEFVLNTTDITQRKAYVKQAVELIIWQHQTVTAVFQPEEIYFMRDNIKNFNPNRYPGAGCEEWYFEDGQSAGHGNVNEIILASTTRPSDYNGFISNSWYDSCVINPTGLGTLQFDNDLSFIPGTATALPSPVAVVNNYTGELSSTDPNTATVWEMSIRDDVYWHEGYGYTMAADAAELKCTVDDIIFFYSICIDDAGPPNTSRGTYQLIFGTDPAKSFVKVDDYTMQFHLNSINADLLSWISSGGMPRHVLDPTYDAGYGVGVRKDGTTAPGYGDWKTDDFNQGLRTAGDTTHAATIGNGPYVLYPGEDPVQQTVTLTKNAHYFKDSDPTWGPIVEDRPDKYIYTWISNKDAAEIALEAGDIDLMDSQFAAQKDYPVMKNKPGIAVAKQLEFGYQTMGYNILNGAGGKLSDLYVRLAISHMIPRQDIVDYLLGGLGQPCYFPFAQQNQYWPGPDQVDPVVYNYTKALEYMEMAGYDMEPFTSTAVTTPGFEALAFFIALGGMAAVVLVYRHRKRSV